MILSLALAAHVTLTGVADTADLRAPASVGTAAPRAVSQEQQVTPTPKTGGVQPKERPQAAPKEEEKAEGTAQETKDEKGRKVIRVEEMTIEGRIQKPQAFYILQRSQLNFEELNKTESFIPRVEKSVENAPF